MQRLNIEITKLEKKIEKDKKKKHEKKTVQHFRTKCEWLWKKLLMKKEKKTEGTLSFSFRCHIQHPFFLSLTYKCCRRIIYINFHFSSMTTCLLGNNIYKQVEGRIQECQPFITSNKILFSFTLYFGLASHFHVVQILIIFFNLKTLIYNTTPKKNK